MAPVVRRTWAPRGQTPVLLQRTRAREKVSSIAAISVSPRRRRVGLYFANYPDANVTIDLLIPFLRDLSRHLGNSIILIWDRLAGHRAGRVVDAMRRRRIFPELLPPYAPELNPVEPFWAYLKRNPLANYAASDTEELNRVARRHMRSIQSKEDLLRSFIRATPLFLRLK